MLRGLKEFITRDNVIDHVVGIVIGIAFGAVANQLARAYLEPLIQALITPGEVSVESSVNDVSSGYSTFLVTAIAVYFFVMVP